MKKRTRYQAVMSAWVLIAAMGMSPVFSAVGIAGNGVVYGSERVLGTDRVYAGENTEKEETLAGSLPGQDGREGEERDREDRDREDSEILEWKTVVTIATPSQAESELEAGLEEEPDKGEILSGKGEINHSFDVSGRFSKEAAEAAETGLRVATASNAMMSLRRASIWGGMEMSDHFDGEGTKENPYEINSAKDLKLLAYNVANEEVDGYEGCYFALTRDISLNDSASWLPIGYFTDLGDSEPKPFKGNFDGQGYRVYNLKISDITQDYAGLFGSLHGATIENLVVDGQVNARSKAAVLAGESNDSIIRNCSAKGQVRGTGVMGGVVGETYDSAILECVNTAGVLGGTDTSGSQEAFAGGICGSAQGSFISDCTSDTTDSYSALYSEGYVGGIAGNIYETEVYNSYVEGKVGSTSADYIGGLVGRLQSGQVKNGRFAGTIGASTSSTLKTAGLFVGLIESGTAELGDDLAYLYTDSEDKYSLNPFGNKLTPQIRLEHHIGAYYSNQRDFSLYQMGGFTKQTNQYFYEELEEGVLGIGKANVHHYAPSKTGDPVRGYLVSIPAIDHGKLSVLEAQNNFAKEIDWANPGALAAGTKVLVYTSPVNQADAEPPVYYEMVPDSLFWTADDFDTKELIATGASELAFTMPEKDITISVGYQAMTNGVVLDKGELRFEVEQIRSGSRWNPQIGWKVTDPQRLTATIIPDSVANKNLVWNVKDTDGSSTDIICVDENGEVSVNQSAKWIQELIKAGVANQELYPSKKITTEAKDYAAVTVTTEAGQKRASAFVTVDFKITDDTVVPVSNIELDQSELSFEITRTLEGNRKSPKETYTVTPSKRLYEKITPEYADNKEVSWSVGDSDILRVDKEGMVSVRENAKWITDFVQAEKESHKDNPYAECNASGSRSSYVTATAKDGEKQAVCAVNVSFRTVDNTTVHVDGVSLNQKELKFSVEKVMTGNRTSPKVEYKVTGAQKVAAVLTPSEAQNKKVDWSVADTGMAAVSADGSVTVKRDAKWIQELEAKDTANLAKNRYAVSTAAGTKETKVTAVTEDGKKTAECRIVVEFKTTDQTVRTSGSSGSGSSGGGGSSSGRGSSSGGGFSSKDRTNGPGVVNQSEGNWLKDSTGWWYRYKDGSYPKSCWKQLPYNGTLEWYHFDSRGYMETGWFTDTDKHVYYLNPVSDGTCGRMVTGWKQIEGKWYYFNTVSDGTKGAMFVNRRTPDEYQVDGKGVWVQ